MNLPAACSLPFPHQLPDPSTIPPLIAASQHDPTTVYYADDPARLRKYEPGLRYRRWAVVDAFCSLKVASWPRAVTIIQLYSARDRANMDPDVVTYAEYNAAFTELVESEHARAIIEGGIA